MSTVELNNDSHSGPGPESTRTDPSDGSIRKNPTRYIMYLMPVEVGWSRFKRPDGKIDISFTVCGLPEAMVDTVVTEIENSLEEFEYFDRD